MTGPDDETENSLEMLHLIRAIGKQAPAKTTTEMSHRMPTSTEGDPFERGEEITDEVLRKIKKRQASQMRAVATISLFVWGEDEDDLRRNAERIAASLNRIYDASASVDELQHRRFGQLGEGKKIELKK